MSVIDLFRMILVKSRHRSTWRSLPNFQIGEKDMCGNVDDYQFRGLTFDVPAQEVPHQVGYFVGILLKCEVSSVEQVKLQII